MSSFLLSVGKFNNKELIDFLNKNGHQEFEDVLKQQNINGDSFLKLTEYDLFRWKLPPTKRNNIWRCISNLKMDPAKFFEKERIKPPIRAKPMEQNYNFKMQLENVIKNQQVHPVKPKLPSPTEDSNAYLVMKGPDPLVHYDDQNYLIPTAGGEQEEEENNYEMPPNEDNQRKPPAILPRGPVPDRDSENYNYIDESELFLQEENNRNGPPSLANRVLPQCIVKPIMATSNNIITNAKQQTKNLKNLATEGNNLIQSTTTNIKQITTMDNNTSLARKLKDFFQKSHNDEMKTNENVQQTTNNYMNVTINSQVNKQVIMKRAEMMEKEYLYLRDRPLPPLPGEMEQINYKNDFKKNTNVEEVTDYENNEFANNLKTKVLDNEELPVYTNTEEVKIQSKPTLPAPPIQLVNVSAFTFKFDDRSPVEEEPDMEDYDQCVFNLNDEPFYRNTDRKGAKELLKNFKDGSFLFRPSKRFFLTLTIKYQHKFFNLGIEKTRENKIRCHSEGSGTSPEFATITDFITYFSREALTFQHETKVVEICLQKTLPKNVF